MTKFGVSPEKEEALYKKMDELGVSEADFDEKFILEYLGRSASLLNKNEQIIKEEMIETKNLGAMRVFVFDICILNLEFVSGRPGATISNDPMSAVAYSTSRLCHRIKK